MLTDYILENVSSLDYYKLKFPNWNGDHNQNVNCPFLEKHEKGKDNTPSFSVNINGKGGCYCHGCGTKIASIIHFEKAISLDKISDEQAASKIYSFLCRPVIAAPEEVADFLFDYSKGLDAAPIVKKKLKDELLITESTIEKFQLGWDSVARRITIPIFDEFYQLVNIRHYRLPSMRDDPKFPKILNTEGFGKPAELFPYPSLFSLCRGKHRPSKVYWFTGERDTILAWDKGLPAFCYTTGENVCKKEWINTLKSLNIKICIVQDNDEAGIKGAQKRIEMLEAAGISAEIIVIPTEEGKDFSEYIINGNTIQDFLELTKQEQFQEQENQHEDEYYPIPRVFDPETIPNAGEYSVFDIGRNPVLLNKPITVKAIVSGKMDRTYSIPYTFEMGGHKYRLPISREMLQLIREKDQNIQKYLHTWLNTRAKATAIDKVTVTEVEIIPMIQPGVDLPYVNQRCYFFGSIIECNKPYEMTIIPTTDMDSQETIGLITSVQPISNVLDAYKFDDVNIQKLIDNFQPEKSSSILDSLLALVDTISQKHTRVYHREDLHIVSLLTWVCPLQFEFPMEGIQRGWLNTLVVGDTETGKSKVCQKLTSLFHCGVFINAESCSYVGLVGGAIKSSSGMFLLRWGKIPLYNRQLVVVEELSGLTTEEISYMSEVRSSGIARYDKGGLSGETSAKTRLICLSNVRDKGRSLGDYPTGVQAALQLVGQNEDLARFDLIITATDDEVDSKIINKDRSTEEKNSFDEEDLKIFKELVMFSWSLKPEQIDFTVGAYRACLQKTLELSKTYHPSLPVFKAGSGRLKLARIALSIACVQMSWDVEKKKLVVEDKHIQAAADLLNRLYKRPSFGYARYSHIQYELQKVIDPELVVIKAKEVFQEKEEDFYFYLNQCTAFTKFELSDAFGVNSFFVERVISQMFLSNLLKKGQRPSEWELSRAGRKWIEKKLQK